MRLVALIRGDVPAFSISGTIGILVVFLAMGCALALVFAMLAAGRRVRPAWWSLTGVGLFAWVVLLTPLRQELGGRPVFIALFVPVGVLLGWASAWLTLLISRAMLDRSGPGGLVYGLLAAPGLVAAIAMPLLMVLGILQVIGVVPIANQ